MAEGCADPWCSKASCCRHLSSQLSGGERRWRLEREAGQVVSTAYRVLFSSERCYKEAGPPTDSQLADVCHSGPNNSVTQAPHLQCVQLLGKRPEGGAGFEPGWQRGQHALAAVLGGRWCLEGGRWDDQGDPPPVRRLGGQLPRSCHQSVLHDVHQLGVDLAGVDVQILGGESEGGSEGGGNTQTRMVRVGVWENECESEDVSDSHHSHPLPPHLRQLVHFHQQHPLFGLQVDPSSPSQPRHRPLTATPRGRVGGGGEEHCPQGRD